MRIVHLTPELASIAKVGGLGDAVFGLAKAQLASGHQPLLILPYYQCAQTDHLDQLRIVEPDLWIEFDKARFGCTIWQGQLEGLEVQLIELLHSDRFFQRDRVYGYEDDTSRFLAFIAACYTWLKMQKGIDIIHLHDWPTAAFSAMAYQRGDRIATLISLHNVEHQGHASHPIFERANLDPQGSSSLLELGLRHIGGIAAVSKTYLKEIQTAEGGRGLEVLLRQLVQSKPSRGIINGIDETYWDPAASELPSPYSNQSLQFTPGQPQAINKRANKEQWQRQSALEVSKAPLIACITRLVPQKGLDLIEHALYQTLELGGQFVLMGTSPLPDIERHFQRLEQHLQHSSRARVMLIYTERMARQLFAAADLILVPSLFEPCGLTQLIGFRYGALAIARETGGLKDTVIDLEHHPLALTQGNGFSFEHPDFRGIGYALTRALRAWNEQPNQWQQWVQRAMSQDVSWRGPSAEYIDLYKAIIKAISPDIAATAPPKLSVTSGAIAVKSSS